MWNPPNFWPRIKEYKEKRRAVTVTGEKRCKKAQRNMTAACKSRINLPLLQTIAMETTDKERKDI